MTDVEVIYKGLTRRKVPLADIDTLPKTDVLFIIFWDGDQDFWSMQGHDFMGIDITNSGMIIFDEWFVEDDLYVTIPTNNLTGNYMKVKRQKWRPDTMINFTGIQVSADDWKAANEFFDKVRTRQI